MAPTDTGRIVRFDGIADWYDALLEDAPHRRRILLAHLGTGTGLCLDVGCGTGRDLETIASTGRTPIGVELSADQLRLARPRAELLVRGDAERLPFRPDTFPTVIGSWISTDVDDFPAMLREIARVLRPAGRFISYGIHPCFSGPSAEARDDGSRIIHPTYREARRHTWAPWWGEGGIRTTVGGVRNVPLADFLNAFIDAGLQLTRVDEPEQDQPIPWSIVITAIKPPLQRRS